MLPTMNAWSALTGLLALSSMASAYNASQAKCRCFPGESCWPSPKVWSAFNKTIDGQLVATIPLGTPCHAPNYDAAVCDYLRSQWLWPEIQYESSSQYCFKLTEAVMNLPRRLWPPSSPMAPATPSTPSPSRARWATTSSTPST